MNSFNYFTDLDSKKLFTIPFQEAIDSLSQRKRLVQEFNDTGAVTPPLDVPVYEFVTAEHEYTKFYFDIDAPYDSLTSSYDLLDHIDELVADGLKIPMEKIGSICSTPSPIKYSIHITLLYKGKRSEIKAAADLLGKYIALKVPGFKAEFVDKAVYGRTQKWRSVYSSKRDQNRFKQPTRHYTSIENSFITLVPDEKFPNLLISANKKLSPKLNWFKCALNHADLQGLWSTTNQIYENWYTVGASLWVETAQRPNLYDDGLALFLQFTADNKWQDEALHKWRTAFTNQEKDLWNKIRKWVIDFNSAIATELDPLFKGTCDKIVDRLNYSAGTIRTTGEVSFPHTPSDFKLVTQTQYILWKQISEHEKFYRYWQEKLLEGGEVHIRALLDTDSIKREYLAKLDACAGSFGASLTPEHLPYGRVYMDNTNFLEWIRKEFDLPLEEEKVEIEKEALAHAQLNYMHTCEDIDKEYTQALLQECAGVTFLGSREYRDPATTIRMIIERDAVYETQFPYQKLLRELFLAADQDWDLFWIALSKFSRDFLFVERVFHLITNCVDDFAAAEAIISLYPFWRRGPTGGIYVYDDTEGFWTTDESIKLGLITRFSSFLETTTSRGITNSATIDAKRKSTLKFIESSETVRSEGSAKFTETKKSGFYRFLFRNGYYDGIEDRFYPKVTLELRGKAETFFGHVNVVFFGKIDNNYTPINEELADMMEEMNTKMFYNMHGNDLGEYWKRCLAMALFGVRKKGFFEHVGDTNSGKSTEIDMIINAFGSYVQCGSTQNFVNQPHDMRSIERQMGWLVPVWMKRLYLCSERTSIKDTCNTERMKGIASGQKDQHQVSQLYEKAQTVEVNFIVSFYINKPLTWDNPKDPALIDRRNVITWFRTYVDTITDPSTQLLKDPETQNWATNKTRQMAYVHLIIQAFKGLVNAGYDVQKEVLLPKPGVLLETEPAAESTALTTEELVEQFIQWVVITGDPTHTILVSELDEIFQTNLDQIASKQKQAIKGYLATLGVKVESKQVRIGANRPRVFTGMYARSTKAQDYSILADMTHLKALLARFNGMIGPATFGCLKAVEEKITSNSQLTFADIELVNQWASEPQKNYFEKHNSFQSFKRSRNNE